MQFRGQNQAPSIIGLRGQGLPIEDVLERAPWLRAARQARNPVIHLVDGFLCVDLEVVLRAAAINNDEIWRQALRPVRVTFLQNTTKGGRDRHPALTVHLVDAFTSEPSCHCPVTPCSATQAASAPLENETAVELLPLFNRRPRPTWGWCRTRATWGDVCSRRVRRRWMKAGACMKPFGRLGVLDRPFVSPSSSAIFVSWENMEINTTLREK